MSFAVDGGDAVSFSKCLDVLAGWGAGGRDEIGGGNRKVQRCSYKLSQSCDAMRSPETEVNRTVLCV